MKDFLLDVEPLDTAPATSFYHKPEQLLIRVLSLTDDMQHVRLLCETTSKLPAVPPYESRLNVSHDIVILPYAFIAPAISSNGGEVTLNESVLSQILKGFYLKLKPAPQPDSVVEALVQQEEQPAMEEPAPEEETTQQTNSEDPDMIQP